MIDFNYKNSQFDYEPYPICYIPDFLDKNLYQALKETYPGIDLFKYKKFLGDKYSLAEKNNKKFYYDFLKKNEPWREFYNAVKSHKFIDDIFHFLRDHNIDQGYRRFFYTKNLRTKKRGPLLRMFDRKLLRSRFEFSIMRANGGHILPHADAPNKLITLVLSFIDKSEWKNEWGGGTDVVLPKDRTLIYNHMNGQLPFDQVEHVKTFPFEENQCVLFIKTYNSWHSVTPMTGPESGLRKTVTINIENIV